MIATRFLFILVFTTASFTFLSFAGVESSQPTALRVMTFNIEDVRSQDLEGPDHPRLKQVAAVIQQLRPNILLLNEIAIRIRSSGNENEESNADRFCSLYLARSQGEGLRPISFNSYTPSSNTGIHSGLDLDASGAVLTQVPQSPQPNLDGSPGRQSAEQREYGNDCLGFGTFPGQYGMALLVSPSLKVDVEQIRTFQRFLWKDLPGHLVPTNTDGSAFYSQEIWEILPLTSKNFVDVPVKLPSGSVVHVLMSHPTPPAFDGDERRNKTRNHDEIRLVRSYIDNDPFLIDDQGRTGGLKEKELFIVMGDLNADPSDGSSINSVMITQLFSSPKLHDDVFPDSLIKIDRLDSTDTARFGLRVDYLLPSARLEITRAGIWREGIENQTFPSDHFPVWMELIVP
jgi:Endonuclease/Exonuclease/phosphatase family